MPRSMFLGCLAATFLVGFAAAQGTAPPPDPRSVQLAGGRFAPLTYDQMTPEQKKAFETLLNGPRRSAAGPFNIMLRSPAFTNAAQLVGLEVRYNSSIPRKLSELAMLITVRYWTVHFEWYAHSRSSLAAGISQTTIDARSREDSCRRVLSASSPGSRMSTDRHLHAAWPECWCRSESSSSPIW